MSLFVMLLVFGVSSVCTAVNPVQVQAATKVGFYTNSNGETFYYDEGGKKHKGWLELGDKKYYFDPSTGVQQKGWMTTADGNKLYFTSGQGYMMTGWVKDSKGNRRYFDKTTGYMYTGWKTIAKKRYFFNKTTGIATTGLKTSGEKTYYFYPKNCAMATGWVEFEGGLKRYFDLSTGVMATKYNDIGGETYYFFSQSGYMATGQLTDSKGNVRYFDDETGAMKKGWAQVSERGRNYFDPETGVMQTGFLELGNDTYYLFSTSGIMATGWLENSKGQKRYFDPETGIMAKGSVTIDGVDYSFSTSTGILMEDTGVAVGRPGQQKTIKNYLLGAVQPVGQVLYVWGGGWNDSNLYGLSENWINWYNSNNSSYDYHNWNDLSDANRRKGLDCSGFVGWSAYQVMHTASYQSDGYTVVSGSVGSFYQGNGWGKIVTASQIASNDYTLKAGDVGYNSGHTWIIMGQCSDKSCVIVHSTPNAGVQIAGTPTPSGYYLSEAITLARKYMERYNGFNKYEYHVSSGNYVPGNNYFRWNRATLADPDNYLKMTADKILLDMFGF